ncbi:E2-like conjugating enzyme atg10 [Blastocladiella emersonii ATCC 22665]|nr:E2-like conjugating enzyme atg10 [Blastocladiella emersonii ATCC 22665]
MHAPEHEYAAALRAFRDLSRAVDGAEWTLIEPAGGGAPPYLTSRRFLPDPRAGEAGDDLEMDSEGVIDDEQTSPVTAPALLQWEVHIAYHAAYTLPALYFCASTLSGSPLTVSQVADVLERQWARGDGRTERGVEAASQLRANLSLAPDRVVRV